MFFLAKFIDPKAFGLYGLFIATISYALYFVGLDFYTYSTRELLKTPKELRAHLIKNQLALSGGLYVFFVPVCLLVLYSLDWSKSMMIWFFPILVFEHINQELYRLLVAISKPIKAAFINFIRQGLWIVSIILIMSLQPNLRHLELVFALWLISGAIASAIGVYTLKQEGYGGWSNQVNWSWIKRGVKVSAGLLIATLALRGIFTFDRYWVEALTNTSLVGAYVLLMSIGGTLLVFLDAGIFAFSYPKLIEFYHSKDQASFKKTFNWMLGLTLVASLGFAIVSLTVLPYLLSWINNPIYFNNSHLFGYILVAMVLYCISMVPHFALYAKGHDKALITSHVTGLVVFLASAWALSVKYSYFAILIGLILSFMCILVMKFYFLFKSNKSQS